MTERLEEMKRILEKFNWSSTSNNKPLLESNSKNVSTNPPPHIDLPILGEKMDEEVKKVLLQREVDVDKAFEDYRFKRNLLDNYWDDIDRKRNWIISTMKEFQSAESSIRSSEEVFRKLKSELELRDYYLEGKKGSPCYEKRVSLRVSDVGRR
ncbi:unnamed protein product [Lactuca saligna]|uniref:Uncharacterized protein n=1 Tax=Lactuca saligna TaxID=75948 RepID=A0AA36E983_LACSI|nr:unnamed protein product [Lactuca saligna]